jgi:phosphoribosylaminoimidazolecarboxamide formyltransferase/IMP cyclohydrolase
VRWQPNMLEMKQEIRIANGLALVQERDDALFSKMELMTKSNCDLDMYMEIIEFGLHAVRQIKSNAIAIIHRTASGIINLIGMGSGQPNRLDSIKLAVDKAKNNLGVDSLASTNTILISDAFFPFEDNIDAIHGAGISLVVEPGGSIRDTHIIERANELDICLFFTGMRHFKH